MEKRQRTRQTKSSWKYLFFIVDSNVWSCKCENLRVPDRKGQKRCILNVQQQKKNNVHVFNFAEFFLFMCTSFLGKDTGIVIRD